MGFFSQQCKRCSHPLLSFYSVNGLNDWMINGVAVTPDGEVLKGEYDGYGRLGEHDEAVGQDNTIWHKACWRLAGTPTEYQGASSHAPDQGFFFTTEHNMEEPQ